MSRPAVLMTPPGFPWVPDLLREHFDAEIAGPDVLEDVLTRRGKEIRGCVGGHTFNAQLFDRLPNLEILASIGVGYNEGHAAEAAKRGIIYTNTPDVLTDEVADITVGLLISAVRQTPAAERFLRAGLWKPGANPPLSPSLRDRSVGIVGLGRIGKAIAHRLEAFGLPISYFGRNKQAGVSYPYYDDLEKLAEAVDTLIIAAPGSDSTFHIVNAKVLAALGERGIVVNIGRGTVVDEAALIDALQRKVIFSAALDVYEKEPQVPAELMAMDNVVLTPHIGSGSVHTRRAMAQLVVDNLVSWFSTGKALTPVPETAHLNPR